MKTYPGRPYPLGATWDGSGTNFALFSENAAKVDLCLFDREKESCVPVAPGPETRGELVSDTREPEVSREERRFEGKAEFEAEARSLALFRIRHPAEHRDCCGPSKRGALGAPFVAMRSVKLRFPNRPG